MNRNTFLKTLFGGLFMPITLKLGNFKNISDNLSNSSKMPVVFVGHGHPMNALLDNDFTRSLAKLGQSIEKPQAILVVSAHWETRGTYVSTNPNPETIYDFGRFDDRLFQIKYPAKGSPTHAKMVQEEVKSTIVKSDDHMGFDHGTWTVLKHIFPAADIPTFQLSLDITQPPQYHYNLAKELYKLRSKGVMVLASGNIVHNLRMLNWRNPQESTFDWAIEFDEKVKKHLNNQHHQPLIDYHKFGKIAQLSIPTNEHYLPLLYTIALQDKKDKLKFTYEGYEYGAISSRCFIIG